MHVANRLGPAKAGAHGGDKVVVAHEELIVVHVIYVVGVHNATLVGAGKREALVGGADVGATGVKSTKLSLGKGRTGVATVLRLDLDVPGALLLGSKEAGTRFLASAGLGARAPGRPARDHAVGGAGLFIALGVLDESTAGSTTIVLSVNDGAATPHLASAASLVTAGVFTPVGELAVNRARSGLAGLGSGEGRTLLATHESLGGDGTSAGLGALATGVGAGRPGGPVSNNTVNGAKVLVALLHGAEGRTCLAVAGVGGHNNTPARLGASAAGLGASGEGGPGRNNAVGAGDNLGGGGCGGLGRGNVGKLNGGNVDGFERGGGRAEVISKGDLGGDVEASSCALVNVLDEVSVLVVDGVVNFVTVVHVLAGDSHEEGEGVSPKGAGFVFLSGINVVTGFHKLLGLATVVSLFVPAGGADGTVFDAVANGGSHALAGLVHEVNSLVGGGTFDVFEAVGRLEAGGTFDFHNDT